MIEINLLEKKNKFKAPVVLGIDFAKLPWKSLIASYLVATYPLEFAKEHFQSQLNLKNAEVLQLRNQLKKIRLDLKKNQGIKDQLSAFNQQIDKLKERSAQVDKIIELKSNPRYLLEKIARSTPEGLWFTELNINDKDEILIKGASESYQSIGGFIASVNESAFFGKTLQLKDSKTEEETVKGVNFRQESFVIQGEIKIYDPFITGK
ncbi:MAG: PilN domain-containing protein [Bacteriovoracaceae bacterium]|nr:PilN domain-containing protein [Bacteriovoracaceae bacterium]